MLIKKCEHCGVEFESNAKSIKKQQLRRFCSHSCGTKHKYLDISYREKMSAIQKECQNRPEVKEKMRKSIEDVWNRDGYKEKMIEKFTIAQNREDVKKAKKISAKEIANRTDVKKKLIRRMQLKWKDPFYRSNQILHIKNYWTIENRQKQSIIVKNYWNDNNKKTFSNKMKLKWQDPIYRKKIIDTLIYIANLPSSKCRFSNRMKLYWSNDENKNKQSKIQKKIHNSEYFKKHILLINKNRWNKPNARNHYINKMQAFWTSDEYKNKVSKRMLIQWANLSWANIQLKKSFIYKDYTLPSGKIVKIQGYEPRVLAELLKTYKETDIVIGVKEMNKEIGRISYVYENIERTYYPDFYIKSKHKIIEVKSQWTYEQHKNKNLAKQKACLEQGFNFEFKIYKNK